MPPLTSLHYFSLALLLAVSPVLAAPPAAATPETQANQAAQAAQAADSATLPRWEELDATQRELLLNPVRERWNSNPGERARLYQHAQRWRTMTPEQRKNAQRGMKRWNNMPPEQRAATRAAFEKMRGMPPEQRKALRDQFKAMSPEQRQGWLQKNAAAQTPASAPPSQQPAPSSRP